MSLSFDNRLAIVDRLRDRVQKLHERRERIQKEVLRSLAAMALSPDTGAKLKRATELIDRMVLDMIDPVQHEDVEWVNRCEVVQDLLTDIENSRQ